MEKEEADRAAAVAEETGDNREVERIILIKEFDNDWIYERRQLCRQETEQDQTVQDR